MTEQDRFHKPAAQKSPVLLSFIKHESFLKRFIAKLMPRQEDVEEVAQEAFLRAYATELKERVDQPKSLLFQIARNEALTRIRNQSKRLVDYIEEIDASLIRAEVPVADEIAERNQRLGLLCEAAASLPYQARKAFLLRISYGMSYKEVAKQMDISVSTVEKHLALALHRCSTFIHDRQNDSTNTMAPKAAAKLRANAKTIE